MPYRISTPSLAMEDETICGKKIKKKFCLKKCGAQRVCKVCAGNKRVGKKTERKIIHCCLSAMNSRGKE
jgi:hypothetical protein